MKLKLQVTAACRNGCVLHGCSYVRIFLSNWHALLISMLNATIALVAKRRHCCCYGDNEESIFQKSTDPTFAHAVMYIIH